MKEYQDQSTWFDIQARDPYGRWVTVDDADSRELAQDKADVGDRVIRRSGLPSTSMVAPVGVGPFDSVPEHSGYLPMVGFGFEVSPAGNTVSGR